MKRGDSHRSGWQGVSLVAITYVYFLIFAQFGFLQRLTTLGIAGTHLKAVMAAMAIGGILLSLLTARLAGMPSPNLRLRIGLGTCGCAALFTLIPLNVAGAVAVSLLIGAGLGLLTVTLVTHLREWVGDRNPLLSVGLGTGVGYFICNFPSLFTASPQMQATIAAGLCVCGIFLPLQRAETACNETVRRPQPAFSLIRVTACFAALVWLDSAAFFIIQSTPALKAGTWGGSLHLWTNAGLHLVAALTGAWLLSRIGLRFVLPAAFVLLALACLLLLDPERALLASVFYPVGVSLYSVALVAYPSLLSSASFVAERGRQAGWIYAVAGWGGSAMGIGMGQNLGHVPPAFVLAAGLVILAPLLFTAFRRRPRELALTAVLLCVAFFLDRIYAPVGASPQQTQIERGRQVYISEGCINCHSQYVRPHTQDEQMWGPVATVQEIRLQQPPLIGNRRQGPDLAEVGVRRSPLWLKAHFFDPAQVSGASIMPSFGFLFNDDRGDDLVAYLESLRGSGTPQHVVAETAWHPSSEALSDANAEDGQRLVHRHCDTCHSADGPTRQMWKNNFKRLPPDLSSGRLLDLPASLSSTQRRDRIAQIAKFGIPGTDMPGHEYMSDEQIASISLWLSLNLAQPDKHD
jgi:cytochrome c oxidase cbb3-type subunit 2